MRKAILSATLRARYVELERLSGEFGELIKEERTRLNALYVGKMARVTGQKGWSKGKIWEVIIYPSVSFTSRKMDISHWEPPVSFMVGPTKKASRSFSHEKIELLDEVEVAADEAVSMMHKRINDRALATLTGRQPCSRCYGNPVRECPQCHGVGYEVVQLKPT